MILLFFACVTTSVVGSVYNRDGSPLTEAIVTFEELDVTTDADGQFIVEPVSLKKGTYTITVRHDGYVLQKSSVDISGKKAIVPSITLDPINETIPYLPINIDPGSD